MKRNLKEKFPVSRIHLDITGKCNFFCKHCHMADFYNHEKTYKDLIRILNELKRNKIKRIALSGGEPFLRKDIFEIIKKCPKEISILTNASLINKSILNKLKLIEKKDNKIITFRISLDGLAAHDIVRSYDHRSILKKIELVRSYEFITVVNTTMSPFLKKKELIRLLDKLEKINVDQWNIDIPFYEGNFKRNKLKIELNFVLKEFESLIKIYLKKDFRIRLDIVGLFCSERIKNGQGFYMCDLKDHPCKYQLHSATINPEGSIQLCPSLHLSFGNIKEGLLNYRKKKKWKEFMKLRRNDFIECNKCKYIFICGGGCRANAFSFSGDISGKDIISCKLMEYLDKKIIKLYPKKIQNQFKKYTSIKRQSI